MSKLVTISLMLGSLGLSAIACFLGSSAVMMNIPILLMVGLAGIGCAIVGAGLAMIGIARAADRRQSVLPKSDGDRGA